MAEVIGPALARGEVVILDRYYFSNIAYQGAAGLDPAAVQAANEAFAPRPDVLLLLDLPVQTGLDRIRSRGDEANAFERADALEQARGLFLDHLGDGCRIDASLPADAVRAQALEAVLRAIAGKVRGVAGFTVEAAEQLAAILGQSVVPEPVPG
ncbi:MAG: hypothetical protein OZ919_11650 [Xanthomonadaceae bacterium]|nr:hypothetical protein [Xanthomonadaceae bacterium]